MSGFRADTARNLIPRWRDPAATSRQGELASLRQAPRELDSSGVEEREADWRNQPTLHFATDLVGAALVVGTHSPAAEEAAMQVLASPKATPLAQAVARRLLNGGEAPPTAPPARQHREAVRGLKRRLADEPRNSLAWVELARHYTIEGQPIPAERAMTMALKLDPNHRFILRAASRLAIHSGEFELAHAIVARNEATPHDPWLMATEIATSRIADRKSRLVKPGLAILERQTFSPRALSELAGALSTLEIHGGSARRAKRLMAQALLEPNENTIAHGQWASTHLSGLVIPRAQLRVSSEALARRHADQGAWAKAVASSWGWLNDQPFSSGPAEFGSYQASVGRDFASGADIARAGRQANPGEFLLSNNLAFCLINLGAPDQLDEAKALLSPFAFADLNPDDRATWLATTGLLQYRTGNPDVGRKLYRRAIEHDRSSHFTATALILFAAEEIRAGSSEAESVLREALEASELSDRPQDVALWLKYLPSPEQTSR
ncbi:MAG: hypothetical protein WKF94_04355 [Solirubrobacteraceae bacterium]